jgi:hypothetical protein
MPARVQREARYLIRTESAAFRPHKEETPRLRLRGVDPLGELHLVWRVPPWTWLCGPATPKCGPTGEAPPAADPGVWLGRKLASPYLPSMALSSSSVK